MNLFDWRMKQGLSQKTCAARVGVDQGLWSKWERCVSRPTLPYAEKIIKITDGAVTLSDLARAGSDARHTRP